ncbi:NUC211 domain-containing protein [Haematococcus lacustris]
MSQALGQVMHLVAKQQLAPDAPTPAKRGKKARSRKTGKAGSVGGTEAAAAAAADAAAKGAGAAPGLEATGSGFVRARAVATAIQGLYCLLEALQGVLSSADYLRALLQLASGAGDAVQRRALRLFADKATQLPHELEALQTSPRVPKAAKAQAVDQLVEAALQICPVVNRSCSAPPQHDPAATTATPPPSSPSPLAQQALVTAFGHVAAACGGYKPQPLLATLPLVLSTLSTSSHSVVRGSVMAAIAATATACGALMLPVLPQATQAVLAAGQACANSLQQQQEQQQLATAAATPGVSAGRTSPPAAVEEALSLEASAVLTALNSLIQHLGPFLSPYLPALLQLLLHPAMHSTSTPSCSRLAAGACSKLIAKIPPRQLLGPLFDSLPLAIGAGLQPLRALLSMVADVAQAMSPAVAASHYESMFAFLLRALDVRATAPPALLGHEHEAEQAAVTALVSLTLKLNEVKFKPLFLRLLDWATTVPAAVQLGAAEGAAASSRGRAAQQSRVITLFTVVCGLADKLRSVLVPYFKYLLDLAVNSLTQPAGQAGGAAGGKTPKRKKQKKGEVGSTALAAASTPGQQQQATGEEAGAAGEVLREAEAWVLRGKVLRALHRCFLYDTVGFVDGDKVARLLPPLVAQLLVAPTPGPCTAAVAQQCAAPDLDTSVKLGKRTPKDVYGTATVAVLVQLAVAANSDEHWKPLNRQVLMTTRSGSPRSCCLALEVVAHLVERLREEYLVLLPETIPFLSELLAHPEVAVESRAQDVMRQLEEVSGEKLDQYLKI